MAGTHHSVASVGRRRLTGVRHRARRQLANRLSRLDAQLAAGEAVAPGTVLEDRAIQLCALQSRWRLAREWEVLLATADAGDPIGRWRIPSATDSIDSARFAITELIGVLCSAEPIDPRGVAAARLLARDGAGPVYRSRHATSLTAAVDTCVRWLHPSANRDQGRASAGGTRTRIQRPDHQRRLR